MWHLAWHLAPGWWVPGEVPGEEVPTSYELISKGADGPKDSPRITEKSRTNEGLVDGHVGVRFGTATHGTFATGSNGGSLSHGGHYHVWQESDQE